MNPYINKNVKTKKEFGYKPLLCINEYMLEYNNLVLFIFNSKDIFFSGVGKKIYYSLFKCTFKNLDYGFLNKQGQKCP